MCLYEANTNKRLGKLNYGINGNETIITDLISIEGNTKKGIGANLVQFVTSRINNGIVTLTTGRTQNFENTYRSNLPPSPIPFYLKLGFTPQNQKDITWISKFMEMYNQGKLDFLNIRCNLVYKGKR